MEPDSRRSDNCGRLSSRDLHLAGELRERDHRHREFLRERLQAGGDLGQLLHAVLALFRRAREQLQVVDDQHIEAALPLQTPGPRRQLGDRNAAGLVDVERDRLHLPRRFGDLVEIILAHVAAADLVGRHAGLLGNDTRGQLFGRHFEREEPDDAAVDRSSSCRRAAARPRRPSRY